MRSLPSGDRLARTVAVLIGIAALLALAPGPAMCTVHVVSADYYYSDCASLKEPIYVVLASGIVLGLLALAVIRRGADVGTDAASDAGAGRPRWPWLLVPAVLALALVGWDVAGLHQVIPGPCDLVGPCVPSRSGQVVEWVPGVLGWPASTIPNGATDPGAGA
jgi:hypothetical protein